MTKNNDFNRIENHFNEIISFLETNLDEDEFCMLIKRDVGGPLVMSKKLSVKMLKGDVKPQDLLPALTMATAFINQIVSNFIKSFGQKNTTKIHLVK